MRAIAHSLLLLAMVSSANAASFAYGVDAADWSIARYRLDPDRGVLRHDGHYPAIKYPVAVAVHPGKQFLLTVIKTGNKVAVHRIDPVTGDLNEIPQSPFSLKGSSPYSISIHPSGQFVYIANRWGGISALRMNVDSGVLTPVSDSLYPAQERTRCVVVHPSGRFVYATNAYANSISAWHINEMTGELTPVTGSPFNTGEPGILTPEIMKIMDAPPEAGGVPYRIAIHPSGRFAYVTNWAGLSLSVFTINETSGVLTPVDGSPVATGGRPYTVEVHPSGRYVYTTSWDSDAVWGYAIDESSGRLTPLPESPYLIYGQSPISMTFSAAGKHAYVSNVNSNSITQFRVDQKTGNLEFMGNVQTRNQPFGLALLEDNSTGSPAVTPADSRPLYLTISKDKNGQYSINSPGLSNRESSAAQKNGKAIQTPSTMPVPAVVDRQHRYVYMAQVNVDDASASGIGVFRINQQTGILTPLPEQTFQLGFAPTDLAIDTDGQFLYAVNRNKQTLGVFEIHPDSGGLSPVVGRSSQTGQGSVAVALDPGGRFSFVANSGDNTVSVFTHRRVNSPAMNAINRQGSYYPVGKMPVDLVVDPSGRYLVVANKDSNTVSMFEIHYRQGSLEPVKNSPFISGKSPTALAVHPDGRLLFVVNEESSDISVFRLKATGGVLSGKSARVRTITGPVAIKLDEQGQFAYVMNKKNEVQKFSVDAKTGKLNPVAVSKGGSVFAIVQ